MKIILLLLLGLPICMSGNNNAQEITIRDLYVCVEKHACESAFKGWKLSFETIFEYDGALDEIEWVITARKDGQTRYFHVSEKIGYERKTGQSVHETRLKEVKTPEEDWSHNFDWDEGEWSGERGTSAHWVPFGDGVVGICSKGESASWGIPKRVCFAREIQP